MASRSKPSAQSAVGTGDLRVELLEAIAKLSPRVKTLYSSNGQLDHYRRLQGLLSKFGDEALATAAFAHGLPAESLRSLESHLGQEALEILDGWRCLRQIDPEDPELAKILQSQVFSSSTDVRVVLLLVFERLDRLDPDGRFADWTLRFRHQPVLPVPHLVQPASSAEMMGTSHLCAYIEKVVAPIAEHWGLWQARNLLRNIALYLQASERFLELAYFAHEQSANQAWSQDHVSIVGDCLKPLLETDFYAKLGLFWEWRHLASLSEQLRSYQPSRWTQKAHLFGFVAIQCPDIPACYQLLGVIHQHFDYKLDYFRDAIGKPTRSGYRALHTAVVDPREPGRLLLLRIFPGQERDSLPRDINFQEFKDRLHRVDVDPTIDEIKVFTPSGAQRFLPPGSTVLDFAASIDPVGVAFVQGAKIQDRVVDPLFLLRRGDLVELVFGDEPQFPPVGWEQQVPEESLARIRSGLREAFRGIVQEAGRKYLIEQLGGGEIDVPILEVFVESGVADLSASNPDIPARDVPWWIRELGVLQLLRQGQRLPFDPNLKDSVAVELIKKIRDRMRRMQVWEASLDVDPRQVSKGAIRQCPDCQPDRKSALATKIEDGVIIVHRQGRRCSVGANSVVRTYISLNQVYVIESDSQPGMAKNIAGIFGDRRVNVVEFVARQLGPSWGVVRAEVEPIGPQRSRELIEDLKCVPGTHRVFAPDEPIPPILLNILPPRPDVHASPISKPPPYVCGPVVYDHQYFYGRENEINELEQLFERAGQRGHPSGEVVFVNGPLKVGKTSLVQRFQRRLDLRQRRFGKPFLSAYYKASVGDTWLDAESLIVAQLQSKLGEVFESWRLSEAKPLLDPQDLPGSLEAIVALPNRPEIVIAVDEVVRLFKASQDLSEQVVALHRFADFVTRCPGILLVWIGPVAPKRYLKPTVAEILGDSSLVSVRPLDLQETKALLRAEKLAPIHQIEFSDKVARSIHKNTGGNPFWVAHLGYEMWKQGQAEGREKIKFTTKMVKRAISELVQLAIPFQGRILPSGYDRDEDRLMLAALFILADEREDPKKTLREASLDELLVEMGEHGVQATRAELKRSLDELAARGGAWHSRETGTWRIAAPLIEEFVRHQFQMLGWQGLATREKGAS